MPFFWFLVAFHYAFFLAREFHYCWEDGGLKMSTTDSCYTIAERVDGVQGTHEGAAKETSPKVTVGQLGPFTGFAVFLTIFYANACFGKYNQLYSAAVTIGGKLHNISTYLRAYYTMPTARWNVLRYPLASVYFFYWSLRDQRRQWKTSGYRNGEVGPVRDDPATFKELCDKVLVPKGLLMQVEATKLQQYQGDKHKMLFSWTLISLARIMSTPPPRGECNNPYLSTLPEQTELMKNVKQEIVELRGAMGSIQNSLKFPIPFTYYHIVNTTVMTYLIILSWCFLYMTPGSQVCTLQTGDTRERA